jgi:predicted transcriptional regulator
MASIEDRVRALELAPPPEQGRPGDITAAVHNAERAARNICADREACLHQEVSEVRAEVRERVDSLQSELAKLDDRIKKIMDARIKVEVESRLLQTLKDYQLIDVNTNEPLHWRNLDGSLRS